MGRGGGRAGGGGRGFGGGSGRGFGGRSGGGSFNRGGGASGWGGSSGRSGPSGGFGGWVPRIPGGGWGYGPFGRGPLRGYGGGCFGCGSNVFVVLIAFAIIATAVFLFANFGGSGQVTKSTVRREPLPAGSVTETEYYTDELGWIKNPTRLVAGMKNFYRETGVQPYLYLTDTIAGSHSPTDAQAEQFAQQTYDFLFKNDEAHVLLIFFEYNQNDYHTWFLTGRQAKTVLDQEAMDILLDFVDKYYYYDMTDEEMFSKAFGDAGARIMTVTRSPWIPVLIVLGVLAVVVILFVWWQNVKKQKNKEAQDTADILNTPLETFGTGEAEDLAEKYKDNDG